MTVPESPDVSPIAPSSEPIASRSVEPTPIFFSFMQRHPKLTVGLALGLLSCISLMISNPNQARYTTYAAEQVDEWLHDKCGTAQGNLQVALLSIPLKDLCQGAVQLGGKGVEFGIEKMTQPRKNYGFFSLYITEIPTQGTFKTLGIGGQFITFQKGE